MEKRGQAAMEFLMTYGWAILAAIVAIGIVGYIVSQQTAGTDMPAVLGQPFQVVGQSANTSHISLDIKNNGAENVNVTSMVVGSCSDNTLSQDISAGGNEIINLNCSSSLSEGETIREDIVVKYTTDTSSLEQSATGSITETVTT